MKRSFSSRSSDTLFLLAGTGLIAGTYGLVRLAYGLYLPDVQRDLDLGSGTAGWIAAGSSVMYCVGALTGFALAATRPRSLAAAAAVTAGVGALTMASSTAPVAFGAAAVVASAGAGLASPALVRLVADRADDGDRGQAVVNSGTGPGLVVAGLLALFLLPDWRTAWALSGAVTLLVGAILLGTAGRPGRQRTPASPRPDADWFRAHVAVLAAALVFGAGSAAVWTYGRTMLHHDGASTVTSALAWVAIGAGGGAVAVTARRTARLGPARLWAVTVLATAVAVLALALDAAQPAVALTACLVFGWGYTAGTGALIAWTGRIDPGRAASGTSMLFVTLVLGQAVGAAGSGILLEGAGSTAAFVVAAGVTAASATASLGRGWKARGREARTA